MKQITLDKAFNLFILSREAFCGDSTVNNYTNTIRYFVDFLESSYEVSAAEIYVHEIDVNDLNDYSIYLKTKVKNSGHPFFPVSKDRTISDRTRKTYLVGMKTFINFLYEDGYIDANPLRKFRMPRVGNKIIEPLTNDEAQIIDDTFNINLGTGCRNLAIFHCLLDQGMRTGEVINLKLDDVNFGEEYLVIRLSKAKKSRILPLSHVAKKYLKRYIEEKRPQASHPYVFCVENGDRLTQDAIKSIFQRMRKSTGLKRVYPHLLRHTFGTSFILGGGSVEILRVMMGHSDIKTTESYLHIANELRFMDNIYRLDKVFLKKYY